MANTAQLKAEYKEKIAPALQKQFNYTSAISDADSCPQEDCCEPGSW